MERKKARRRLEELHLSLCRIVLERQQVMAHKHIAIDTWLDALGMKSYENAFTQYKGVEELLHLSEADIKDLGLKNSAHRAKIISSLRLLKEKYEKGQRIIPSIHRSYSATAQLSSVPPQSPPANYPDYQVVNVSKERLSHDLSIELQGDRSELKSWPWYHGSISRQRAESLVGKEGDFLVRDCISRPGDFVLTCCSKGVPLHFMINCDVKEREFQAPEISYHFEDVNFNSVQDLVEFYRSHKKFITNSSGVIITNPVARTMPLGYYDMKYGAMSNLIDVGHGHYSNMQSPRSSPYSSPSVSPGGSPRSRRKRTQRTGSQPLLNFDDDGSGSDNDTIKRHIDRCDSLPTIQFDRSTPPRQETSTLPLPTYHQRAGSEPVLIPDINQHNISNRNYLTLPQKMTPSNSDSNLSRPPPPKPSRIPSIKYKQKPKVQVRNKELYEDDGRDYSDYFQVKEQPSWLSHDQTQVISVDNRLTNGIDKSSSIRYQNSFHTVDNSMADYDNNFNSIKSTQSENPHVIVTKNEFEVQRSRLQSDTRMSVLDRDYSSPPETPIATVNNSNYLINNSNRRCMDQNNILRSKTVSIPNHIESRMSYSPSTYNSSLLPVENKPLDPSVLLKVKSLLLELNGYKLARHLTKVDVDVLKVVEESDLGVGVTSGLELITLPHGKQLRQDLIERSYCMKVFAMVMILTCNKVTERARMLSQWIQIAMELRSALGNLFGFTIIMEGLMSPQIQRLKDTWLILRQNHTSSAFLFDTKLKSFYKSLNDGSGLLPVQDVCIPDISPLIWLLERDSDSIMDYLPWENSDPNSGLDILLTHLDTARLITAQCGLYRVTTQAVFQNFEEDHEIREMFKTEFHLRILWGFKGANVNRKDRQNKFEQLLTVLSDRAEVPGDDGTAV